MSGYQSTLVLPALAPGKVSVLYQWDESSSQADASCELQVIRRTFPVSMEEKEKSYIFTAEVPGLTPQDVKVGMGSMNCTNVTT